MQSSAYKWFKPRSGSRHTTIFVLGFLFFPVFGIITIFTMDDPGIIPIAIAMILFGSLAILYILIRASANGFKYGLGPDIFLKRGRRTRSIGFDDVEGVTVLDGADLASYLGILAARIAESKMQMDLRRWWENSKVYGEIILWVSVVITETERISGGQLSITKYTMNMEGPVTVISLKNGEALMLTPEKAEEFAVLLKSHGAADIDAPSCIASIPSPSSSFDREGNIRRGRRRRIISIVMFFVIAGAVLGWFFLAGPGSADYVPEADELEQSIIPRAYGEWDSDKLFIFVVPADRLELNYELTIGMSVAEGIEPYAAEAIAADSEKQTGLVISEDELSSMRIILEGFTRVQYNGTVNNDAGDVFHGFEISGSGLQMIQQDYY